jgi:hypothetical protein
MRKWQLLSLLTLALPFGSLLARIAGLFHPGGMNDGGMW